MLITKTLFKDISDSEGNFEDNWEFAITEVIVNLEEKINAKKETIQKQLTDLEYLETHSEEAISVFEGIEVISETPMIKKNDAFMSKSFDNTSIHSKSKIEGKKKTVQWKDDSSTSKVDVTDELMFLKSVNSEISPRFVSKGDTPKEEIKNAPTDKYDGYLDSSKES